MARGSIKRRPDTGQWRARLRDQHGRPISKGFSTKDAAEKWLRDTLRAVEAGRYLPPRERKALEDAERRAAERSTVGAVHQLWRSGLDLKQSTMVAYDSLWRTVVADRWAEVPVTAVSYPAAKTWLTNLNLSASRRRQAWHVLSSVLSTAVASGVLGSNPLAGVRGALPKLPPPDTSKRMLTPAEIEAVAEWVRQRHGDRGDRMAVLLLVMGVCALRWGEAAALQRRDVDLRGNLRIERTVQPLTREPGRRELVWGEPKTERGRRTVPTPAWLYDQLRPLLEGLSPDQLIFGTPRRPDRPWGGSNFARQILQPALDALGLPRVRVHDLRHAAITAWLEVDRLSLQTVSALAGHSSVTFTLSRYGHLVEDYRDVARDAMNNRARVSERSPDLVTWTNRDR
ncbi:MAG TPA: site-specific integrase [Jiangellaceae bacterium]|nr:site-specific integrase [Jiangellaceae bacterium]